MAAPGRIEQGYLGKLLRLTLLAPDIVEVVLDERLVRGLGLPQLLEPVPMEWTAQRKALTNTEYRLPGSQQRTGRPAYPGEEQPE
jgi:hypothetical protein